MSDGEIRVSVSEWGEGRSLHLRWTDPISGRRRARSAKTNDWGEAERAAGELEKQLRAGADVSPSKITWAEFLRRFDDEKLSAMCKETRNAYRVALGHVTRLLDPDRLAKLTTQAVTTLVGKLRKEGQGAANIARTLRHVKGAANWAHRQGYLQVVPRFDMPKGGGRMKGRPISGEEYERLLAKVPAVRPDDAADWERLLTALWLSGLRLGEALRLSWDDGPFQLDLSGKHPAFRIQPEGQKSHKAEICPCTPDFAAWVLAATPEAERSGRVFPLRVSNLRQVSRAVSDIGKKAGVLVDPETGKTASAHDLRRSFGTRWAKRVMPAVLKRLMRHANIATTMGFYVGIDADEIASGLWANHAPADGNGGGFGNDLGNGGPKSGVFEGAENCRNSRSSKGLE